MNLKGNLTSGSLGDLGFSILKKLEIQNKNKQLS